jgi:hypothetical protein
VVVQQFFTKRSFTQKFWMATTVTNGEQCRRVLRLSSQFSVIQSEAVALFWLLLEIDRKKRIRRCREFLPRSSPILQQRVNWDRFIEVHSKTPTFRRHIRMDYGSFLKLLGYIKEKISVDCGMAELRGGAIIPEVRLYTVLRWLAGGSYTDILYFCGISKTAFYDVLWSTIDALINAEELRIHFPQTVDECLEAAQGFRSISNGEAMDACVSVVDGYHLEIRPPSKNETRNVRSFFSGHYSSYGVNVQGACDHLCRFVFLGVVAPGVVGDRDALFQGPCPLGNLIENLPGLFL